MYGLNSELVYRAPKTGEYYIAITEATGENSGGYYLSVEAARPGTETVVVPSSQQIVESRFGKMTVYESPTSDFSILVPDAWAEGVAEEISNATFVATSPTGHRVIVLEIDAPKWNSLEEFADRFLEGFETGTGEVDVLLSETIQPAPEITAKRVDFSALAGTVTISALFHLDQETGVVVLYDFPAEEFGNNRELVNYSLGTFRIN